MHWCDVCALKLYNTKHHNLQGIGNPWTGNCIIIPNVDYDAYKCGNIGFSKQVEIIKDILSPLSTGGVLENLYILPLIRCNETISCELDNISYSRCIRYFAEDVRTYDFKNILLLGSAAARFLSTDITPYLSTILISSNKRKYAISYSPLIKYIDSDKFETFKENLIRWYNFINDDDYSNYDIKFI